MDPMYGLPSSSFRGCVHRVRSGAMMVMKSASGVLHDLEGIGLQQGRTGRRRSPPAAPGGCPPRRWRRRTSAVRPRRRRGRGRRRRWPCPRLPSGPARTADCATNSLRAMLQRWIINTFHDQYERNGELCHFTPMMDITPDRRDEPRAWAAASSRLSIRRQSWPLNEESQLRRPARPQRRARQVPLSLHCRHRRRRSSAPWSACCSPRSASPSSRSATGSSS